MGNLTFVLRYFEMALASSGLVAAVNTDLLPIVAPGKDQCRTIEPHRRRLYRGVLPIHDQVLVRGAVVQAI